MKRCIFDWRKVVFCRELLSARGFAARALMLSMAFAICHGAGFREYTSVLCGTSPTGQALDALSALLACLYLVVYLAFVLIVPVMLLSAAMMKALESVVMRYSRSPQTISAGTRRTPDSPATARAASRDSAA